jgi:predicted permease
MNRLISLGDVRLSLRLIAKQPILSATIIMALATGICLVMIGFTFREVIVNRTLPYQAGDRFARFIAFDRDGHRIAPDIERYHAFRDRATSFEHVGTVVERVFTVTYGPSEVDAIAGASTTPRSMRWVEASPIAGRPLIPADGEPGADRVVLLRESLWRRRFNADPNMIGRSITIGGQLRTVVGIMPDSFEFPGIGELWLPLDELTLGGLSETTPGARMFGVLRRDVSFEEATTEIEALSSQLPTRNEPGHVARVLVRSYTNDSPDADFATSAVMFVLVTVLFVVASHVATLVFARTWARAPELAVRSALGASRTRVVGQLFFEILLLGSIAAWIGATAAFVILRYVRASIDSWPSWITLQPTPRTVAFAIFLAFLVSVVSGLLPAWRITRHDLRNSLQAGRAFVAGGFGRIGAVLLVVEIALSVGLLNGAVTMARAFASYVNEVPTLPRNQVLTVQLGRIESAAMRDQIVEAAARMPGVIAAGAGQGLPRIYPSPRPTAIEPIGDEPVQAAMPAPSHAVGAGFLEAIGGRTVSGRLFTAADFLKGAAPVAIVNEPFVRKFFGGRNPIGRRLRVDATRKDGAPEPWREIVGVVPDLGLSVANTGLAAGFYTPVRDETLYYLAVRTTTAPLALAPRLRAAVANVNPDLQLEEFHTLDDAGREERVFLSSAAATLTAVGVIALALSIVGIYALLSFMVTRRTREIGIRVALGATRAHVLTTITGGAMLYLAIGGAVGSAFGWLLVQLRWMLLVSIPDVEVWMPSTIFLALAIAGCAACWLPARRALAVRPAEALSAD